MSGQWKLIHAPEYSAGKWRLVDGDGTPIQVIDDGLPTIVGGNTRAAAADMIVRFFQQAAEQNLRLKSRLAELGNPWL